MWNNINILSHYLFISYLLKILHRQDPKNNTKQNIFISKYFIFLHIMIYNNVHIIIIRL